MGDYFIITMTMISSKNLFFYNDHNLGNEKRNNRETLNSIQQLHRYKTKDIYIYNSNNMCLNIQSFKITFYNIVYLTFELNALFFHYSKYLKYICYRIKICRVRFFITHTFNSKKSLWVLLNVNTSLQGFVFIYENQNHDCTYVNEIDFSHEINLL